MEFLLVRTATAGLVGEVAIYAVAFAGTVLHFAAAVRRDRRPVSLRAFGRHLFPRAVLASRWTWLDIAFYVVNRLLLAAVFPSVAIMVVVVARAVQGAWAAALAPWDVAPAVPQNAVSLAAFLLCGLLVRDFSAFYVHYMQHRVPALWEFHKVHHAPESLIPPTGHRLHPLDQLLGTAAEAPLLGAIVGTYAWLAHQDLSQLILCSVGFYTLVNVVTFAPLRHSHIDLRLGRLERVLLSPAHHRLHHSVERPHWDKNFAAIFPVWDRLFGTFLEPPPSDTYRLGLPDGQSLHYATLLGCYLRPFRAIRDGVRLGGLRHMLRAAPLAGHAPDVRADNGHAVVPAPRPAGTATDRRTPDPRQPASPPFAGPPFAAPHFADPKRPSEP